MAKIKKATPNVGEDVEKKDPHSLWVELQTSAAIEWTRAETSQKYKSKPPIWPSYPAPWSVPEVTPQILAELSPLRLYSHSQETERTCRPFSWGVHSKNVVHSHNKMLFSWKENEIMRFSGKWMELENTTLSEARQPRPRKPNTECSLWIFRCEDRAWNNCRSQVSSVQFLLQW